LYNNASNIIMITCSSDNVIKGAKQIMVNGIQAVGPVERYPTNIVFNVNKYSFVW
jgi:hypothetical protein